MKFIFYSPVAFEPWDWRSSVEQGIGGSETSHVEMAWRLAKRGHEVKTYAPIPADCPGEWRGTTWQPIEAANFAEDGLWILYRCPEVVDRFLWPWRPARLWLVMQDWDYPEAFTPQRIERLERIVPLCQSHASWLSRQHRDPAFDARLWITSNGLKPELIKEVEDEATLAPIARNPKRIMYASSPDRGLLPLLHSFHRAVEVVDDLELHVFYGFNNLDKLIARQGPESPFARQKAQILKLAAHPNITLHGRVSQNQLYREWLKTGLWVYQTNFWETSCITCMEAQALGGVPIYNPIWALGENVHHGLMIRGNATDDPLVGARFAYGIVRLATDPDLQTRIRDAMMPDARARFSWENFVDQWERCAADPRAELPA
jgi:glycosyltransferase involved in cell wall biosynthesis